jgi:hypothetical protein
MRSNDVHGVHSERLSEDFWCVHAPECGVVRHAHQQIERLLRDTLPAIRIGEC